MESNRTNPLKVGWADNISNIVQRINKSWCGGKFWPLCTDHSEVGPCHPAGHLQLHALTFFTPPYTVYHGYSTWWIVTPIPKLQNAANTVTGVWLTTTSTSTVFTVFKQWLTEGVSHSRPADSTAAGLVWHTHAQMQLSFLQLSGIKTSRDQIWENSRTEISENVLLNILGPCHAILILFLQ